MKVIAKISRRHATTPTLGYVRPVLYFDEYANKYVIAKEQDFPNTGDIFIYGGFPNIETSVSHEELFELQNVKKNEAKYEQGNPISCYYSATSDGFRRLFPLEFIKIFNGELDIKSRVIKDISPLPQQTAPIFLRQDHYIIGPLIYSDGTAYPVKLGDIDLEEELIEESVEEFFESNRDCIFKYDERDISNFIIGDYVLDFSSLAARQPYETIYFGTKDSLFNWGRQFLKTKLSEQEISLLGKLKDIELPNSSNAIESQKLSILFNYIDEQNSWFNIDIPRYINNYLSTDGGQLYLEKFLKDNEVAFFNEYRKSELNDIEGKISAKQAELDGVELQINDLKQKLSTQDDKIFDGIAEEEKLKLKSIITDEAKRQSAIAYVEESRKLADVIDEIKKNEGVKSYLEGQITILQDREKTIREAMKAVKDDFFNNTDFAGKVMEAKIYTDLINNIDPSPIETDGGKNKKYFDKRINTLAFENSKSFLLEIQSRLAKENRNIAFNDLVNLLVTIQQNFLVVFAGLPGVGKTSLVEKIGKVLGCQSNSRFLKIPVAKGWTSSRDLLGYFNPLTKQYQKSKTGLKDFLEACESDTNSNLTVPSLVLLDEANLSAIEHYWSDFLSVTDGEYQKAINITDSQIIQFGEGLRFLATINYDHTTEILSNRLISRAPIIRLSNLSGYSSNSSEWNGSFADLFTFDQINQYLYPKSSKGAFKDDIKNKFESIIGSLEDDNGLGTPTIIGFRKYNAVEQYCRTAGVLMEDDNKFVALDYAISQNILPLIAGRGEGYHKRLLTLIEKTQGLPLANALLTRIVKNGEENFKNFGYFS